MINYSPDSQAKYGFSYSSLKADYERFSAMSDADFRASLKQILHFTCYISWIKELSPRDTLSDTGIVHELIHLLVIDGVPSRRFKRAHEQFNKLCRLV